MRKIFLIMLFTVSLISRQTVEVSANHFKGIEKEFKTILSDKVVVKSDEGILRCDFLVIFYGEDKKPIKYEASKNLDFDIKFKQSRYTGKADTLIYDVFENQYTMLGNVYLKEEVTNRDIKANKIVFDGNTGDYTISGQGKEPVKLKFEIGK